MRITVIEIEANAEEMKSSNTLADNLTATLNNALFKARFATAEPYEESDGDNDE